MSVRLIILGLLAEGNRHPYDIRQTIKNRNWHLTFRIKDGSLYYAVDQMRGEGLIEVAETIPVQGERRPDKVVYRITDKGKEALRETIYGELAKDFYPRHPIFAALPFIRHADPDKIVPILRERIEACRERIEHLNRVLEIKSDRIPFGSVRLIEAIARLNEMERDWLGELVLDAKEGRLAGKGSMPDGERRSGEA